MFKKKKKNHAVDEHCTSEKTFLDHNLISIFLCTESCLALPINLIHFFLQETILHHCKDNFILSLETEVFDDMAALVT